MSIAEAALAVLAVRVSMVDDGRKKENLTVLLNAGHGGGNSVHVHVGEPFDYGDDEARDDVIIADARAQSAMRRTSTYEEKAARPPHPKGPQLPFPHFPFPETLSSA